jgi:EAL domain-containing protein (putative c-di-GMP-specific phosphodiesterase class I)/GGDEF domain-containing protein
VTVDVPEVPRSGGAPGGRLATRAELLEYAYKALARAERRGWSTAFVVIDVEASRAASGTRAEGMGNQVREVTGARVVDGVRISDCVAELPGSSKGAASTAPTSNRFVAVCEDVGSVTAAQSLAGRVRRSVEQPMLAADGTEVSVTAVVGVAIGGPPKRSVEHRLRDAEEALGEAKRRGEGARVVVAEGRPAERELRGEKEVALRRALEDSRFVLRYQPTVSLRSDLISGVEALLHWDQDERGLIPRRGFATVAEETGLVVPIGEWMFNEVCAQIARWQHTSPERPPVVSMKVSAAQLGRRLLATVSEALTASGVAAGHLCLEVDENTLIADVDGPGHLRELAALGVGLAVEEFGAAYASLTYLQRVPVRRLKIATALLERMDRDGDDSLVAATIDAAHALGVHVVAVGVESPTQLARLRGLGCDDAQGQLVFPPLAAASITSRLLGGTRPPP